jgi:hypothetical protein
MRCSTNLLITRRAALFAPLFLASCASEPPAPSVAPRDLAAARLDRAAALAWLNAYRAKAGLGAVSLDPDLNAHAEKQAQAMADAERLSHDVNGGFSARLARRACACARPGRMSAPDIFRPKPRCNPGPLRRSTTRTCGSRRRRGSGSRWRRIRRADTGRSGRWRSRTASEDAPGREHQTNTHRRR